MTLSEIIARLEAATGPDRELERAIHESGLVPGVMMLFCMSYIDTAKLLIPKDPDICWCVRQCPGEQAEAWVWNQFAAPGIMVSKGFNPATALCIAALKARNV